MPISGRNDHRVLFGALNVATGHRVLLRRARAGATDFQAFLRCLRAKHYRAGQPIWLLLDKAPGHTAASSLALAARLDITLLWLPRQCSELNAMDHLWRPLKRDLAANRQRPDIDALAIQAEAWVLDLAGRFDVSVSFVRDLSRRFRASGSVAAKAHGGGRTPSADAVVCRAVEKLVAAHNDHTVDEHRQSLAEAGHRLSRSALGRTLL